jgi:hypothetical protein
MMTHAHKLYDIQQVPSLPIYWYDPTTQLVFSDGFTAPFLPYSCTDTGGLPGEHQETTRETAGTGWEDTSAQPGTGQEDMPAVKNIGWLLAEDGRALCIPMIPYAAMRHSKRVLFDRSIFLNQLNIKQMATKITAAKIKNDAAFERTRENVEEFSRSGQAGKLLRDTFREVLINAADREVSARLVKVLFRVVSTDLVNDRGNRRVNNGEVAQLEGFNFNKKAGLTDTLYARHTVTFDRASGQATLNIPSFVPKLMVQASKGTTHFRITLAVAAINFDKGTREYAREATADLPWDNNPTALITVSAALPANLPDHVFIVVGIELYQKVNAKMYALKSGEFNAASIVKVVPKV